MITTNDTNIGELVASDYRTAEIFNKYQIDFCFNGNRSIYEACLENKINTEEVIMDINKIISSDNNQTASYNEFPVDLLIQYIEKKHHQYIERQIPILKGYLKKVISAHGNRHSELHDILELFDDSAAALTSQMKTKEIILFPQVRKMCIAKKQGIKNPMPPSGSFQNAINVMMKEHNAEGERFKKIRTKSNNYTAPNDGCGSYSTTYKLLEEFEKDFHLHIHLENNILFPKAVELEMYNHLCDE